MNQASQLEQQSNTNPRKPLASDHSPVPISLDLQLLATALGSLLLDSSDNGKTTVYNRNSHQVAQRGTGEPSLRQVD